MYGHTNTIFSRAAKFLGQSTSPDSTLPLTLPSAPLLTPNLLIPDQFNAAEFDSVPALNSEVGNSSSCSGCSSYGSPSSLASHCTQSLSQRPAFIQRSVSSHSLMKNGFRQLFSSAPEFLDSDAGPFRRVFSTGDLQVSSVKLLKCPLSFHVRTFRSLCVLATCKKKKLCVVKHPFPFNYD